MSDIEKQSPEIEPAANQTQEADPTQAGNVPTDDTSHAITATPPEAEARVDSEAAREVPAKDAPSSTTPHGGSWSSIFNALAAMGPISIILAIACLAWHDFVNPANAVYCPAEVKSITAFLHSVAQSSWLTPMGLDNGAWTLAQWPAFYWGIGLLALIPGVDAYLLPLAEALGGTLAVLGVWGLALAAGFGGRAAFAGAVILLCTPLFAPLPHFMGSAAFAAGCLLAALIFFCRGWKAGFSLFNLPLAFIFTALAGLAGGILHFTVPLLASILFLIWQGRLKRAQTWDALFGFILMLALIGGWLGWIMIGHGDEGYLPGLFDTALDISWPLHRLWWLPIALGLCGTLPWLLSVLGVSWGRVITQSATSLKQSRQDNASALVWISLVLALGISVFIPQFHPCAVAIACLAAPLLGKAILHLSSLGNRFFFLLASLLILAAGTAMLALHFDSTQNLLLGLLPLSLPSFAPPTLLSLSALPIVAAILIIGGLFGFFFVKRDRHTGGLLYGLLLVIIITQPCRLMLVPELAANPDLPLLSSSDIFSLTEQALTPAQMATPSAQIPDEPQTPSDPSVTQQLTPANPETAGQPEQAPASDPAAEPQAAGKENPAEDKMIIIEENAPDAVPPAAPDNGNEATPGTISAPVEIPALPNQ